MQHLLIDACGWAAVIDSGMNFDIELGKVLGKPDILLLPKVLEELEALDIQRPRSKKLLLGMLKAKATQIEEHEDSGAHTDDQILDLACENGWVVLTVDVQLKRRLFEAGTPVLEVTKGKRLHLLEGL